MQTEFSQQIVQEVTGSSTFYIALPTTAGVAGVYVIKSLTLFSTQAIPTAANSLSIISATNTSGANLYYIYSDSTGSAANTLKTVFSPTEQIIVRQAFIGVRVEYATIGDVGNVCVNVSYSFIPNTNANYSNFNTAKFAVTNTTGASFTGLSSTQATIIKSIRAVNSSGSSATITPQITTGSTTVALDIARAIPDFTSAAVSPIIYLSSNQTISFVVTGTVEIIYSYTLDPNA